MHEHACTCLHRLPRLWGRLCSCATHETHPKQSRCPRSGRMMWWVLLSKALSLSKRSWFRPRDDTWTASRRTCLGIHERRSSLQLPGMFATREQAPSLRVGCDAPTSCSLSHQAISRACCQCPRGGEGERDGSAVEGDLFFEGFSCDRAAKDTVCGIISNQIQLDVTSSDCEARMRRKVPRAIQYERHRRDPVARRIGSRRERLRIRNISGNFFRGASWHVQQDGAAMQCRSSKGNCKGKWV